MLGVAPFSLKSNRIVEQVLEFFQLFPSVKAATLKKKTLLF